MNFKTNKIKDIHETYFLELSQLYPPGEAACLLDMIFEHRLRITRIQRTTYPERRLSESDMLAVHFDVKALKKFKPIQYIHGETEFFDLKLLVNEHVLIPRPETEELVQWIIDGNRQNGDFSILDIGTGSGCIALALKKNLPEAEIFGCDVSAEALKVAGKNAESTQLPVTFFLMDILKESEWGNQHIFDVLVSNPPYVTQSEKSEMSANVLDYEPPQALFVSDEDPLIFYRSILSFAKHHLKPGGSLYFEINRQFGRELIQLAIVDGFQKIGLRKDLSGNDRMFCATKPEHD